MSCSAQLIDPSMRLQPSPTHGAAPWGLCWSLTPALLYESWRGGVSPAGPAGRSIGYPAVSAPPLRFVSNGSGLPKAAIAPSVLNCRVELGELSPTVAASVPLAGSTLARCLARGPSFSGLAAEGPVLG